MKRLKKHTDLTVGDKFTLGELFNHRGWDYYMYLNQITPKYYSIISIDKKTKNVVGFNKITKEQFQEYEEKGFVYYLE